MIRGWLPTVLNARPRPVEVVHALMERAKNDPSIHNVGPHVIRVVPVMGTCDASIVAVEALASQLLPSSFPVR